MRDWLHLFHGRGGQCCQNGAWTVDGHVDLTVLFDFFKCTPPLEKNAGQHDQQGEMIVLTERINVWIRQKGAFTSPLVLLMHTYK